MLRNRPILVALGWVVALGVVHQFVLSPLLPHSWLSYSTRPLWDKSEAPNRVISHFERPGEGKEGSEQWCGLHGWKARDEEVEVWDATIFSTELDLLLLRLSELTPTVSKFFLVEASHSFTGIPRDAILATALSHDPRFAPFKESIIYHFHKGRALSPNESPFAQEIEVRQSMDALLKASLADQPTGTPAPVLLFGDVDELPRRATAELLQACDFGEGEGGGEQTVHLGMREYVYSYGWEVGGEAASWRASATVWSQGGKGEGEFYRHGKQTERVLVDSGWHCSWCFRTLAEFETKAKGYSHVDRLGSRPSALLRPARIQKTLCEGTDMFRMLPEAYTYRDLVAKLALLPSHSATNVPSYLREHPNEMPYLLPGGCLREDFDPTA